MRSALVLFLSAALCLTLFGCASETLPDGDADLELDGDLDAEGEAEVEAEARPRPESPEGVDYPKTLWRDEVKPGQTFTWGYFPRDYYPAIPKTGMNFPIVWDEANKRILAVDATEYSYRTDWSFVLYSLTEEKSEILDYITFPPILNDGWRWGYMPATTIDAVMVDDVIYVSFYKDGWLYDNPDYVAAGILTYDLNTKSVNYLYVSVQKWSRIDIIGRMVKETDASLIVRCESGFNRIFLENGTFESLLSYCDPEQQYLSACREINQPEYSNLDGFLFPNSNYLGWLEFLGRLASMGKNQTGDLLIEAQSEGFSGNCKHWVEYSECEAVWLPFSMDCCISNKAIIQFKDTTYVLSGTHSALFTIDGVRGGLQRVAGKPLQSDLWGFSPNGTPAADAILGSTQNWFITDDGDVMWLSPYDYSIRGIAGPLDEWVK